jgi:hypothetical protein
MLEMSQSEQVSKRALYVPVRAIQRGEIEPPVGSELERQMAEAWPADRPRPVGGRVVERDIKERIDDAELVNRAVRSFHPELQFELRDQVPQRMNRRAHRIGPAENALRVGPPGAIRMVFDLGVNLRKVPVVNARSPVALIKLSRKDRVHDCVEG